MLTRCVVLILLVSCMAETAVHAQTTSIGIKGGYQVVLNSSSIPVLYGSADCGQFSNGTSNGFFGGITAEYSLFGDALELSGAILYSFRPARLTAKTQDGFEILDPNTSTYVPMVREHVFTSNLGYVVVDMGLRSRPFSDLPIYLRASFDAGNPLVNATYNQTEEIVSPDGVLFDDGRKRRPSADGEFPGLGTAFGVSGAVGMIVGLSRTVELSPEVFYRHGLQSISSFSNWNQSFFGVGLQLRYRMLDDEMPPPPPPPPPPPVEVVEVVPDPEPELVVAPPKVTVASVSSAPLEIRETVVTQTFPLLPYVFFDSASSVLRPTYMNSEDITGFSEHGLPKSTLPIYYRMLDIIGARMRASQTSNLIITGTTDGLEHSAVGPRMQLAAGRAASVVEYMSSKWGIAPSRFVVKSVERPALVSNERYAEGLEENRRVELSSTDGSLLDPVVHTRFNEYVPVQPVHDFQVDVLNPEVARSWSFGTQHGLTELGSRSGSGSPPSLIRFDLTQEMTDKLGPVVGNIDTLDARLLIDQTSADPAQASTRFPLVKTVSNFEVSRLSLIVFDYDRADISEQNMEMMRRVVTSSSAEGSVATIIGSTDRLGELKHNKTLSTDRARSVEKFVRTIAPGLRVTEVKGIGPAIVPYSNDLPEGRFYCRTVSLTITTPLRGR